MVSAKTWVRINYGARLTKERLMLYVSVLVSFICIALSNSTTSWHIKDWFKDDVFGDEYRGLWKVCYDRENRGIDTSCVETIGDAFLNNVRSSMCLSFLMYAIVLGYLIAMQFRANLHLTYVGIALIISSMSALFGLTLFASTQPIPRVHWLFETRYGWSFGIGWFGMLFSMITGIVCISMPRYEAVHPGAVQEKSTTVPYIPISELHASTDDAPSAPVAPVAPPAQGTQGASGASGATYSKAEEANAKY